MCRLHPHRYSGAESDDDSDRDDRRQQPAVIFNWRRILIFVQYNNIRINESMGFESICWVSARASRAESSKSIRRRSHYYHAIAMKIRFRCVQSVPFQFCPFRDPCYAACGVQWEWDPFVWYWWCCRKRTYTKRANKLRVGRLRDVRTPRRCLEINSNIYKM